MERHDEEVDRIVRTAWSELEREAEPPDPDFALFDDRLRRARSRRAIVRAAVAGVAFAAVVGAAFVVSRSWSVREPSSAPFAAVHDVATAGPASTAAPIRLSPRPGLVVFAQAGANVTVLSPDHIDVDRGRIDLELQSPHHDGHVAVQTPSDTVHVTGTVISVAVNEEGTEIGVLRGTTTVERPDGTMVSIAAGELLPAGARSVVPLPAASARRLAALFPAAPPVEVASAGPAAPAVPAVPPAVAAPAAGGPAEVAPPPAVPSESAEDIYARAEAAMRGGRFDEAARLLERVAALSPRGSEREGTALFDLAGIREELGDTAGRIAVLRRYLERQPQGAFREDAREGLCRALEGSGAPDALHACLEDYLAEFPRGRQAAWARRALDGGAAGPSDTPR